MTGPYDRQDSLIMKVAHFKNLNPTPVAEALHRALSGDFGPILATAALRRAADHCRVPIDKTSAEDGRVMLSMILDSVRAYRTPQQLEKLRMLLARAIDEAAGTRD